MIIRDLNSDAVRQPYDVCIVGAGAAGIVLASKLGGGGLRVAIVESGNESRWNRAAHALNRAEVAGLWHYGVHTGRYRALGGSTTRWSGQLMELDDSDFQARDWIGFGGWPIRKAEISPYYDTVRDILSIGVPDIRTEPDIRDIRDVIAAEGSLDYVFSRISPTLKFFQKFRESIINSRNQHYIWNACATELVFNENRSRCQRMKIVTFSGQEVCLSAGAFVLCMGGIENSRFLLNQGDNIRNRSRKIGRHFQDHINVDLGGVSLVDRRRTAFLGPERLVFHAVEHTPKLKLTEAAQRKFGVLNAAGMIDCDQRFGMLMKAAALTIFGPRGAVRRQDVLRFLWGSPYFVKEMAGSRVKSLSFLKSRKRRMVVYCEQDPGGESAISLSDQKDRFGMRVARLDWGISDLEVRTVNCFLESARSALENRGLLRFDLRRTVDRDYVVAHGSDSYHHIGGTRMSDDEATGVVDRNLKVYGVDNLYIGGSSVFPCGGFANPTQTILALSLRLGDHLDARLRGGG